MLPFEMVHFPFCRCSARINEHEIVNTQFIRLAPVAITHDGLCSKKGIYWLNAPCT